MPIGVGAAIAGSAAVGAGASLISSSKAANAQKSAAAQASAIQQQQLVEAQREYDQNRADLAPYRDAGYVALGQLARGTASGPDYAGYVKANPDVFADWQKNYEGTDNPWSDISAYGEHHYTDYGKAEGRSINTQSGEFNTPYDASKFTTDPGYQFRLDQGNKGIQASAAAAGGVLSGGTLKALARYNSGEASQEFNNAYNRYQADLSGRYSRLASLAGIGQQATNSTISASESNTATQQAGANNIAANALAAGQASSSQYVAAGNGINNAAQGALKNYISLGKIGSGSGGYGGYTGTGDYGYGDAGAYGVYGSDGII